MKDSFSLMMQKMGIQPSKLQFKWQSDDSYDDQHDYGDPLYTVKQEEIKDLPYANLGLILSKAKSGESIKGTGFLISPNLVLTSAHNLYQKYPERPSQIVQYSKFYPGQWGMLGKAYEVEQMFVPKIYQKYQQMTDDYALLKLKEKVNNKEFIVLSGDIELLKKQEKLANISIFGYSSNLFSYVNHFDENTLQAYPVGLTRSGKIKQINFEKKEMLHIISTFKGQSGAPILFYQKQSMVTVVGVHKGFKKDKQNAYNHANAGRLLTFQLIELFRNEASRMGAEKFQIKNQSSLTSILQQKTRMAQKICQQGQNFYAAKNFQEASASYKKAIQIHERNAVALNGLGKIQLLMNRDLRKTEYYCEKAIEIDPTYPEPYFILINLMPSPMFVKIRMKFFEDIAGKYPGRSYAEKAVKKLRQKIQM